MHGAACAVAVQLRQVQRFRDNPLPREGGIAMDQKRQNFLAMLGIAPNALTRTRLPLDHGVNRLEMTRVCRETNLNFGARRKFPNGAISEMIFHIAIAGDQIGNVVLAELGEDDAQRFFQEIRQHVQSTAVRHAHANFFHGSGGTFVQNRIENHHQRFRALQ